MFKDKKFETYIEVVSPLLSLIGRFDDSQKCIKIEFFSETHYAYERLMKKHYNKEGGKAQSSKRREEENKTKKRKRSTRKRPRPQEEG